MTTTEAIKKYVSCVFAQGDWVELRLIQTGQVQKQWWKAENLLEVLPDMVEMNKHGWHIYAGANPRKDYGLSFDVNVPLCRCVFADFDHIETDGISWADYVDQKIADAGLPEPTLVMNSGHGIHAYWRLAEPAEPEIWTQTQKRLSAALESDPVIHNPERIMRLPGFRNHKDPPADCYLLRSDKSIVWPLADISRALPLAAKPREQESNPPAIQDGYTEIKARATLYACKWPACSEGDRNQVAYRHSAQMLIDFALHESDAWDVVCEWNRSNNPPLDENELRGTFRSAQQHAKGTKGTKAVSARRRQREKPAEPVATPRVTVSPSDELAAMIDAQVSGRYTNIDWPWSILTESGQCLTPGTRTVLVGSIGGSKSFMLLQALAHWAENGVRAAVLELERKRDFHLVRLLAQISGEASVTRPSWIREHPDEIKALFTEHQGQINQIGAMIHTANRQITTQEAAQWCEDRASEGCRLIAIDPVTSMSRGQQSWRDDEAFMNRVEKIATESGASMVFVTHAKKGSANMPELDSLSGAAAWARFADAALWLDAHDERESNVRTCMGHSAYTHNRTLHLLKTRSGEGTGLRIAYQFEVESGLTLREHGFITKTKKGDGNGGG